MPSGYSTANPRAGPTAFAAILMAAGITGFPSARGEAQRFPAHPMVIDLSKPPYQLKGDGVSDNAEAFQAALNEHVGRHRLLWLPKGTYLISRTLEWPKRHDGHEKWGFTQLRGEDRDGTVIRLKDGTFTRPDSPRTMIRVGGFGSADWFHNYVENLTFHVGDGNPGATALRFFSNNTGAVRDCRFIAPAGSGSVALDLAHHDMNGPLLVKNCDFTGFRRAITTGHAVNSQTFEHLTLRDQRELGISNEGQAATIRRLTSANTVPALGTYGSFVLVEASLRGSGDSAANSPALINYNGGAIFLRDVTTSGYRRALADMETPDFAAAWRVDGEDKPGSAGPVIDEYSSRKTTTLFPSPARSLRQPVKETPPARWESPEKWAVVDAFGADPTGATDSAAAIRRAIASGASTLFFPGSYRCAETIELGGKVHTVVGLGGSLNYGNRDLINFRIADGDSPAIEIRHFGHLGGGIEIDTRRSVILRSLETHTLQGTARAEGGELFIEDVVGGNFRFRKQAVWARQLNIENEGTHLTNHGGSVWVLGYKTERGGTLAHTFGGGSTEILGGFSYTTTAGKLAPMFVNDNSATWTFFAERCFNGDPYTTLVREIRDGETRELPAAGNHTAPFSGR
jgi:hypothetical protein